ncbi:MAG: galactokinase [Clostridiales bacterium]|nr:galactokinase [Clostridiales bacterium]
MERTLEQIYGEDGKYRKRYEHLFARFQEEWKGDMAEFFSAPGRTEIIGNHTDHNGGKVIASSIDMDTICAAYPNGSDRVNIISEGYEEVVMVDLFPKEKGEIKDPDINPTKALLQGLFEGIRNLGYQVSGFDAYISTDVIRAAGVSSSASLEMLLCAVVNFFFNKNAMSCLDYAKAGQYAENHYWNKASGLMDQLACAVGGPVLFDFSKDAVYEKLDFSLDDMGYDLIIVNTGKGHADLSKEYSEIPSEMGAVAERLGVKQLSEVSFTKLLDHMQNVITNLHNDRAILRALHFYEENRRVEEVAQAIRNKEEEKLLALMQESGSSSWKWLQNCYVAEKNTGSESFYPAWKEQKIPLVLALTEIFIRQTGRGCCRVHGGGFAGVIQAVIPKEQTPKYMEFIESVVDKDRIYKMRLRKDGAVRVLLKRQ